MRIRCGDNSCRFEEGTQSWFACVAIDKLCNLRPTILRGPRFFQELLE